MIKLGGLVTEKNSDSKNIYEGVKLSKDELKDIKDIVSSDIEPFMTRIGEYAGPEYFTAVRNELIAAINKIKIPKIK